MTTQGNQPERDWPRPTGVAGEVASGLTSSSETESVHEAGASTAADVPGARQPGTESPARPTSDTGAGTRSTGQGVANAAGEVKDAAASQAADLKDEALQRGSDVAAVAKEELTNVTGEFRDQAQRLWNETSGQLQEQARSGQQQVADLLHSLAGELGHMASRSEQDGPLTAFARSAAAKGGELSHWLATNEPRDVLIEVRRFARRRPVVFLAGAAAAGIVIGRLSRGLMANSSESSFAPSRAIADRPAVTPELRETVELGSEADYPAARIEDGPVLASEGLDLAGEPVARREVP